MNNMANKKKSRIDKMNKEITDIKNPPHDPNIYDPTVYINKNGEYDFTTAPGYNEDVVRFNINKVKHPRSMVIVAPTA
jgi:hypothetical protein